MKPRVEQWLDYLGSTKTGWAILALALILGFFFARQNVPPLDASLPSLPNDPTMQLGQVARTTARLVAEPQCREVARAMLEATNQQDFSFFSNAYATNCVPRK